MAPKPFGAFLKKAGTGDMRIVQLTKDKELVCRTVLQALPHWFGIPESVDNYVLNAAHQPMIAAFDGDEAIGMLTLAYHSPWNLEIAAMGVMPDFHRKSVGRMLIEAAEDYARGQNIKALTVKTLSSKDPDEGYRKTRAFYESVGFELFEEMPDLWDADNPAAVYIKPLA